MTTKEKEKVYLAYSDSVFSSEDLLSDWIAVSGVLLTTSLLFYHMSRVKSLKVKPFIAKIISIGFIIVSTAYLLYALYPYTQRMNFTIKKCKSMDNCSKDQLITLSILKKSYLFLGALSVLFQLLIVYLVIYTI
jgi:hypothetical protein